MICVLAGIRKQTVLWDSGRYRSEDDSDSPRRDPFALGDDLIKAQARGVTRREALRFL